MTTILSANATSIHAGGAWRPKDEAHRQEAREVEDGGSRLKGAGDKGDRTGQTEHELAHGPPSSSASPPADVALMDELRGIVSLLEGEGYGWSAMRLLAGLDQVERLARRVSELEREVGTQAGSSQDDLTKAGEVQPVTAPASAPTLTPERVNPTVDEIRRQHREDRTIKSPLYAVGVLLDNLDAERAKASEPPYDLIFEVQELRGTKTMLEKANASLRAQVARLEGERSETQMTPTTAKQQDLEDGNWWRGVCGYLGATLVGWTYRNNALVRFGDRDVNLPEVVAEAVDALCKKASQVETERDEYRAIAQTVPEEVDHYSGLAEKYSDQNTELRAMLERVQNVVLAAWEAASEGGDWDGGAIQDLLEKQDLIRKERVTEPCGEFCHCAEFDDFPQDCYRLTPDLARLLAEDVNRPPSGSSPPEEKR